MKTWKHIMMIAMLLLALSFLFGSVGYIVSAQTTRTLLAAGIILWLAFLAMCHDQQQLNNVQQATCDVLFSEQKRKFEESIELINLYRAQYRQPFFIPKEYSIVFDIIESKLEHTRILSSHLTHAILRAHHLSVVHDLLAQQEKPVHCLYLSERQMEYARMPHRVLLRLTTLRKKISFYEAYSLVPELKQAHTLLKGRRNPDLMKKKYGEQWELSLVSEIERVTSSIERQLFDIRRPIHNHLK